MNVVQARTLSSNRRTTSVEVVADGEPVATVEVSRARRPLLLTTATGPWAGAPPAPRCDPDAWTAEASARAAADRWRDPHPAIRTVTSLTLHVPGAVAPTTVLAAVGAHLVDDGVRRLDVRVPAGDALGAALGGDHWVQGSVDGDVIASLSTGYPWAKALRTDDRLQSLIGPLPRGAQRAVRKVAAVHLRQVPELARTTATEIAAIARHRSSPGSPRSHPADGAPTGSYPFAASRYRTVRTALDHVPDPLRSAPFIDIGCGDGRVLVEALAAGFPRALGREFDAELARQAQQAVGSAGHVEVGDALAAPLPDDVQVVFLNNPFDSGVVARFAPMVAETLERQPRPLLVLYLNPRPIEPLLHAGLVLVEVNPLFSILANRAAT